MTRRPPRSPLFPYTTLFRSQVANRRASGAPGFERAFHAKAALGVENADRKSTRLNSSHVALSRMPSSFCNDTATTEISTLSLHDALPISGREPAGQWRPRLRACLPREGRARRGERRSEEHTSELQSRGLISYAVFFL